MRSFWDGNLLVGLVAIPVGLCSARKGTDSSLTSLHRDCGAKLEPRRWCGAHERVVEDSEIVRAFEVAAGQYVTLEADEIASVEPTDTRTIEMVETISRSMLDELQVDASYFLLPARTPIGRKPYELFRRVLAERPAIALLCRLVVRKHEWVATVRAHPARKVLILEKLFPTSQLVDPLQIEQQLRDVTVADDELKLARELIEKRTRVRQKLPKEALQVDQGERLLDLVDRKLAGDTIVHSPTTSAPLTEPLPAVGELVQALQRSIATQRPRQHTKRRASPGPVKR